jgi:hypothetical protein
VTSRNVTEYGVKFARDDIGAGEPFAHDDLLKVKE